MFQGKQKQRSTHTTGPGDPNSKAMEFKRKSSILDANNDVKDEKIKKIKWKSAGR